MVSSSKAIVALGNLSREQLGAVAVFAQKRPTSSITLSHPCSELPITGKVHYCRVRPSPRRVYSSEEYWCWTQSHAKVTTALGNELVTIQKFSPKRIKASSASRIPRYKVWFLSITSPQPLYFSWVERGVAPQLRSSSLGDLPAVNDNSSGSLSVPSSPTTKTSSVECLSAPSSPSIRVSCFDMEPLFDPMITEVGDIDMRDDVQLQQERRHHSQPSIPFNILREESLDFLTEWM